MSNELRFRATMDDKVSGPLGKIKDKFDLLGKSKGAQSILSGVGVGVGIKALGMLQGAMGGLGDVVADSIKAASDLAETQSKVNVVFGKSAQDIDTWGKTAAKSLGLSSQAAMESAASLGNLFTGIGQTQEQAAKMSKSVVQLASDLASFNNVDPTEALEKLRSGLAGESEPLRSMGVFLSEAKVKAKALELGLGDAHGELTEGEKIIARYNIILEETTNAQGDFAKTSDGLANSQRIANAELADSEALLGQRLLPAQLAVTKAQIDFATGLGRVLVANDKTVEGLTAHAETLQRLSLIVPFFGGALKDTAAALYGEADALDASADKTASLGKQTGDLSKHARGLHKPLVDAKTDIKGVGKAAEVAAPQMEDFLAAVFGPAELKGEKAGKILEISDLKAQIAEIQKKPNVSTADKLKLKELRGQLSGAREDLIKLDVKLAALGDAPSKKDLQKFLDARRRQTQGWNDDLQESFDLLAAIAGTGGTSHTPSKHQKAKPGAEGGWTGLNGPELRLTGEQGPEYIVPNDKLGMLGGGGGGSPVVLNIQVDKYTLARVVDERLYYDYSRSSPSAVRK